MNRLYRSIATRFDSDHWNRERYFKYFRIKTAITAVQIWIKSALGEVHTKVLILRFCFMVLKKISICHRSLYMAATVVAPKVM